MYLRLRILYSLAVLGRGLLCIANIINSFRNEWRSIGNGEASMYSWWLYSWTSRCLQYKLRACWRNVRHSEGRLLPDVISCTTRSAILMRSSNLPGHGTAWHIYDGWKTLRFKWTSSDADKSQRFNTAVWSYPEPFPSTNIKTCLGNTNFNIILLSSGPLSVRIQKGLRTCILHKSSPPQYRNPSPVAVWRRTGFQVSAVPRFANLSVCQISRISRINWHNFREWRIRTNMDAVVDYLR